MRITEQDKTFMREAIRLADESVKNGGGPFGAVIVKDGEIVAGSSNSVTRDNDPTAHAEVNTIRQAHVSGRHLLGAYQVHLLRQHEKGCRRHRLRRRLHLQGAGATRTGSRRARHPLAARRGSQDLPCLGSQAGQN